VLAAYPHGEPKPTDFRLEEATVPEPGAGEVLLRVLFLSLDPYMRGRINATNGARIEIGGLMAGGTVAEIVASNYPGFAAGDVVVSYSGWQEYAVSNGADLRILEPSALPVSTALGVLGMPGLTAYAGLLTIGRPIAGETVVVAAATGPVGSAVGQIAKIRGARAVGVAGGPEKCRALLDEFKFDAAIDRRAPDFAERLRAACPSGIDVYFELVGGPVFRAVVPLLNEFARIPVCGLVSEYNDTELPAGPDTLPVLMRTILGKGLTLRGFSVSDFAELRPEFERDMRAWIADGRVAYREDIVDGLEAAPQALIGMLRGKNFGKQLVRVASGPRTAAASSLD
jgi:NADPH-dependent curcumin reductase CurA